MATVTMIEADRIAGQKPPHQLSQSRRTGTEQKMGVIVHQHPCVATRLSGGDKLRQSVNKIFLISLVPEDGFALDATDDHMMQHPGRV
jgi:hypothetical protein